MKLVAPARFAFFVVAASLTACGSSGEWDDADESANAPANTPLESTTSSALTGTPVAGAKVVTTTRLNMRTGPSTSSSIMRVLPSGAALSLLAPNAENGFYRVRDDAGRTGYCHGAYLRAAGGDETAAPESPAPSGAFPTSGTFESRGTGYYPDASPLEGGFVDRKGAKLRTLQQYLAGSAEYVSVAMDVNAFAYGQKLRIKELETKYGRTIEFRVVDTGGAFKGKGRTRIDICTANEKASLDPTINSELTLVAVD